MKDLFQRLSGAGGAAAETGQPRLTLAALGKHPGWDDHLPGIGVETEALIHVKQALYGEGIRRQVDSGAWEKLEAEKRCEGFDHIFLWLRPGHTVLGLLWSSTDGKGRAKYPMVLCVDGEAISPGFMVDKVLPGLERLRDACKAASTAAQVTADCEAAQTQLQALAGAVTVDSGPVPPIGARRTFLERRELGPDRTGLLRVLHELGTAGGSTTQTGGPAAGGREDLHPRHIRLPLVSELRTAGMLLWGTFFRCAITDAVPLLLLSRASVDWLDVIIGEPAGEDLFCLQASPKALPLATEIPYEVSADLKTHLHELEARFLGHSVAKAPSGPAPAAAPLPISLAGKGPSTPKAGGRRNWFWLGGVAVVLAGVAAVLFFNAGKPNPASAPVGNTPKGPAPTPTAGAAGPASKAPEKAAPVPSAEDLKFEAAMKEGKAAFNRSDFKEALAQATAARGIRADDASAKELMRDAQAKLDGVEMEQRYQTAIDNGNAALAKKDFATAITQAGIALGINTNDEVATKLKVEAQRQSEAVAAAQMIEQKYQAAMASGKAAFDKTNYLEAIKQFDIALRSKRGDSEAANRKELAQKRQAEVVSAPTPPVPAAVAGGETKTLTNSLGMEFIWLGNLAGGGVLLSKYEVTQKQYQSVMGKLPKDQKSQDDQLPVANVSFEDARSFCDLLSKKESKTYVLPSKDEWLAATGLSAQDVANAWKVAIDRGWLDKEVTSWRGTVSVPSRVGSLGPQANGLCDVFGNVREWVAEGESAGFSYNSAAGRTKTLFLGANEALWILPATGIRCVMRAGN